MRRKSKPNIAHPAWTEAKYWQYVRQGLRKMGQSWPPKWEVIKDAQRPSQSSNRKLKWEYQCNRCKSWFPKKEVEVDHKVKCGELNTFDDLAGFVARLLCAKQDMQLLCKVCHKDKTVTDK